MKKIFWLLFLTFSALKADPMATHGMLLFGDKVTYLSHLPMFHSPHNYQVIMKISLKEAVIMAYPTLVKYEQIKMEDPNALFTLLPKPLDLSKIIDGSLTDFQAEIYEGHFEQGGKSLGPILVHVEQLIFSKKLDGTNSSNYEQYLIFGEQQEFYGAHLIASKPSFDLIMKVDQPISSHSCLGGCVVTRADGVWFPEEVPVTFSITNHEIPKEGITLQQIWTNSTRLGVYSDALKTNVKKVLYLEQGELSH